jgi:uncharacterized protein (TIGR02246 family)
MRPHTRKVAALAAIVASVGLTGGWIYRSAGQATPNTVLVAAEEGKPAKESGDIAAIRKTAELFAKAFNSGDAKVVASFWTAEGEYISPDGERLKGRAAIEKAYAEYFKKAEKAQVEVKIETIRMLGKHVALEEGTLALKYPGDKTPGVSRYSVLHVREDTGWHMATVQEWVPDPSELITLKDVEWLVGEWSAKSDEAEADVNYAWDDAKAFLRGTYTLKRDGKIATSGTHIIGKNPSGGLRAWVFDASGSFGESFWSNEENHWIIEGAGTLPDGSDVTAINVLIQLGPDAFSWQAIERSAGGTMLPGTPPIRVTRVKSK